MTQLRTLGLLLLAACAVAPMAATPGPVPGGEPVHAAPPVTSAPPPPSFVDAFASKLRAAPREAMFAAAAAQPAQVLADRQLAATIAGHLGAAQTRDRSWIVQVPADGSARVTSCTSSRGAVSSILNPPGDQVADLHGRTVTLPLAVRPGDSLVLLSGAEGGNDEQPLGFASASGAVDEAMAIVFVPYAVSSDLYRPPAIGRRDNPIVHFLRTFSPISEALSQLALLPRAVDRDAVAAEVGPGWDANSAPPTFARSLALHRRFAGDLYNDWRCAGRVPWTQHQGYGTYFASAVSDAMLLLCSTAPLELKAPLAHALVQRGLDDIGAAADGKQLYPLGGHCWGRKPPVVLCGHLFGLEVFANPSAALGRRCFAEDAFAPATWWFGGGWTATWPYSLAPGFDGLKVTQAPAIATWGDPEAPNHDTFGWCFAYYSQAVPAQIGATLSCVLMGRGSALNPQLVQVVRQHMAGPPAAAHAQLAAFADGAWDPAWGRSYPTQFAAACWRRYAPTP